MTATLPRTEYLEWVSSVLPNIGCTAVGSTTNYCIGPFNAAFYCSTDALAGELEDGGVVNQAVDGGHGRHGVLEGLLADREDFDVRDAGLVPGGHPRPALAIRPRKPPLARFSSSEQGGIYVQGSSMLWALSPRYARLVMNTVRRNTSKRFALRICEPRKLHLMELRWSFIGA